MKIFPFNISKNTWHNYSNYLRWVYSDIVSLKQYLQYFNPDYYILNESILATQSNTWDIVNFGGDRDNPFFDYNKGKVCFPSTLKFREGILITEPNTYIYLGNQELVNDDTQIDAEAQIEWSSAIEKGLLTPVPMGQVVLSIRNPHGNFNEQHPDLLNPSSYLITSKPTSGLYLPQSATNSMIYTFSPNGQAILGTNIIFSLEFTPARYFSVDEKRSFISKQWSTQGASWELEDAEPTIKTQSVSGAIWNDSYPLMHNLFTQNENNIREDFITDDSFEVKDLNIANHYTSLYNINVDTESPKNLKVYVSII